MSAVIHLHEHRLAKRLGTSIGVYLACKAYGLSPIQCAAVMRRARKDFDGGKSPAMTIADARANARETFADEYARMEAATSMDESDSDCIDMG